MRERMKLILKIFVLITLPIWGYFYIMNLMFGEIYCNISEWVDKKFDKII
jgi:hypothetical protein